MSCAGAVSVDVTGGTSRHLSTPKRLARVARLLPRPSRRSWRPDPAATHLSAFSEVMGPLPVHASVFSEATPPGRCVRSGKRGAASRRSSVSSRRLWGAHSSVVADSHDHRVDATIATVGGCRAKISACERNTGCSFSDALIPRSGRRPAVRELGSIVALVIGSQQTLPRGICATASWQCTRPAALARGRSFNAKAIVRSTVSRRAKHSSGLSIRRAIVITRSRRPHWARRPT